MSVSLATSHHSRGVWFSCQQGSCGSFGYEPSLEGSVVFGSSLWASCCLCSENPSDCALVSSRDEFWEFPGRVSGVPKHRRRSQPAEPEKPNSGSKFFGMENPAPAESTAFNAAGGKPWPFSRKASFARRRADPTPDLSQTLAGDPAGANGASNGGIRAEIRPSLGFWGLLPFSLRLPSTGSGG